MAKSVKPIPDGFHCVTPGLTVNDAARALEFYKKAFGAQELLRMPGPQGKIIHAEIKIGDSILFVSDEFSDRPHACRSPQTLKGTTGGIFVYVPDVDAAFAQAVKAGAKAVMPLADMFWGDRYGQVLDPFGHLWSLATHTEDLSPQEMEKRQREFFAAAGKP